VSDRILLALVFIESLKPSSAFRLGLTLESEIVVIDSLLKF
jgi:hypothetical protein